MNKRSRKFPTKMWLLCDGRTIIKTFTTEKAAIQHKADHCCGLKLVHRTARKGEGYGARRIKVDRRIKRTEQTISGGKPKRRFLHRLLGRFLHRLLGGKEI